VEQVSWDDVQDFIGRLNAASPGITYRLLTEAEWEYAARAGSTLDYYGPQHDIAWMAANSSVTTHPVGLKMPNAWGLYDVQGNVSEWAADGGRAYRDEPVVDPVGSSPNIRGIRGGSYQSLPNDARVSFRGAGITTSRSQGGGVRLARTP